MGKRYSQDQFLKDGLLNLKDATVVAKKTQDLLVKKQSKSKILHAYWRIISQLKSNGIRAVKTTKRNTGIDPTEFSSHLSKGNYTIYIYPPILQDVAIALSSLFFQLSWIRAVELDTITFSLLNQDFKLYGSSSFLSNHEFLINPNTGEHIHYAFNPTHRGTLNKPHDIYFMQRDWALLKKSASIYPVLFGAGLLLAFSSSGFVPQVKDIITNKDYDKVVDKNCNLNLVF